MAFEMISKVVIFEFAIFTTVEKTKRESEIVTFTTMALYPEGGKRYRIAGQIAAAWLRYDAKEQVRERAWFYTGRVNLI